MFKCDQIYESIFTCVLTLLNISKCFSSNMKKNSIFSKVEKLKQQQLKSDAPSFVLRILKCFWVKASIDGTETLIRLKKQKKKTPNKHTLEPQTLRRCRSYFTDTLVFTRFPNTSRPGCGLLRSALIWCVCAAGRRGPARLTVLMYHFSPAAAKYESMVAAEWTLTPLGGTPAFAVVENRSLVP